MLNSFASVALDTGTKACICRHDLPSFSRAVITAFFSVCSGRPRYSPFDLARAMP